MISTRIVNVFVSPFGVVQVIRRFQADGTFWFEGESYNLGLKQASDYTHLTEEQLKEFPNAIKHCNCCGETYTKVSYRALPLVGYLDPNTEYEGEMRNCPCPARTTLTVLTKDLK